MKQSIWINIQLIAIILVVVFLYSFTSNRNEKRKIIKTQIEIKDNAAPFLTTAMVNKLLIDNFGGTLSIQKDGLDLKKIEQSINKHSMVDNSQVYVSVDGKIEAVVKQKIPVARFFDENSSFYIDYKGGKIPLSNNFSARVPLVYGDIQNPYSNKIIGFLQTIYNDDFLKKNIIGIKILADGSLIMKSRNYEYDIIFGRTINMERKWNNYKAFYQKAVQDTLIDSYKRINLKFTKQVVCTK
jgi:cell division protein FtsQ